MHNQKGPAESGGREEEEKEEEECAFIISLWGISPTHLLLLSLPGSCVWQRRHCPQEVPPPLCSDRSFLRRSSFGPRGRKRKGLSAPSRLTTAFKRRGNKTTLGAIIASGHKRLSSSSPSFCLPLSLLFFSYFFSHRSRYNSDQASQPNKKGSLSSEECEPLLFGLLLSFWGPTTTADSSSLLFLWFFSEPEAAWSVV